MPNYITKHMTETVIVFLKQWKHEKENGEVYQIPTVDLLIEELEASLTK